MSRLKPKGRAKVAEVKEELAVGNQEVSGVKARLSASMAIPVIGRIGPEGATSGTERIKA